MHEIAGLYRKLEDKEILIIQLQMVIILLLSYIIYENSKKLIY